MSDLPKNRGWGDGAFMHVPELQGRIIDPVDSRFRLVDGKRAAWDDPENPHAYPPDWRYPDALREEKRRGFLAGRMDRDLWVFGYGSLMWDPALFIEEIRKATLHGYYRHFCLRSEVGRGTREQPGLMAALDHGGTCHGLVFRIAAERVDLETEILWKREMVGHAYLPRFVPVHTPQGPVEALAFTMDHECPRYMPHLNLDETARMIATGVGVIGPNAQYVDYLADQLALLGVTDHAFDALHARVQEILIDIDTKDQR